MNVLVVDDESIVLISCRRVLEADGFRVVTATSAQSAVQAIENLKPDLLLVDIKMPGQDGLSLMRKAGSEWPDVPIIAMSGYSTEETIRDALAMGACSFIAKPFTPDELLEKVYGVLHKEVTHGKKGSGH